jgi:hypothetical protein
MPNHFTTLIMDTWCNVCDRPMIECPDECCHRAPKPNMIGERAGLDCDTCWNPVGLCICPTKCTDNQKG